MNLKRITDRAKDVVEKRGGTESLKQDAAELKRIAQGQGTIKDKAKRAADALKDPGREAKGSPGTAEAASAGTPKTASKPEPAERL